MTKPVTANVISFDDSRAVKYLNTVINGFMNDPPDSELQEGYLHAVLCLYEEGLGKGDSRVDHLNKLMEDRANARDKN